MGSQRFFMALLLKRERIIGTTRRAAQRSSGTSLHQAAWRKLLGPDRVDIAFISPFRRGSLRIV